jgi:NADPH:quinone reductase-like Zn-dependent oxidoreductase
MASLLRAVDARSTLSTAWRRSMAYDQLGFTTFLPEWTTPAATGAPVMRAFILEKYGPPETLRMAEVKKPDPAAEQALVKVLAVSVNPADWRSMRAKPFFSRATLGLLRPKHRIPGVDVAGRVQAVGSGVHDFKAGDEVYANLLDHRSGGFAEYVSVPVDVMSLKPANLSFEEAAAVPMAGVTALQAFATTEKFRPGSGC